MKPLRMALTKGRLEQATVALLEASGMNCGSLREKGRRLILPVGGPESVPELEVVLSKAPDVLCELGVVGKDVIQEHGGRFFEILDLGFGRCGFALACPRGADFFHGYQSKTVATKYPNVARRFFESKAMDVRIIKIEGSVELAPLLGLAEVIVDIVETGATLRENGLEVVERISEISARLIVNPAAMKLRKGEIEELAARLEREKAREEAKR